MCFRAVDLTDIKQDETVIVSLPLGRMIEVEWIDGDANAIRIVGYENRRHFIADEEYRLAGYQPMLRCFYEHIPITIS